MYRSYFFVCFFLIFKKQKIEHGKKPDTGPGCRLYPAFYTIISPKILLPVPGNRYPQNVPPVC